MTIQWSDLQRRQVKGVLDLYPLDSGECAQAARAIVPIARGLDQGARGRLIRPDPVVAPRARFIVPRTLSPAPMWWNHVTVEVTAHNVDGLPGVGGHEVATYLETWFEHPEALRIEDVDLDGENL